MALSSFDEYSEHLSESNGIVTYMTGNIGIASRLNSLYRAVGTTAHAAPGAAAQVFASSYGTGLSFPTPFSLSNPPDKYYIMGARFNPGNLFCGFYMLADRLSHQSGLNATSTATQTTNLPTSALPRYTDGVGVMVGLEVYTQIGTTAATATISYTNSDGTPGRTGLVTIGGTSNNAVGRCYIMGLQGPDKGVRSVESVTLNGSTATAGNFGVTLFKPLYIFPMTNSEGPYQSDFVTGGMIGSLVGLTPQTTLMAFAIAQTVTINSSVFLYVCDGNT